MEKKVTHSSLLTYLWGYNYSADLSLRATIANIEDKMPEKDSAYGWPYFNRSYYSIFGRAVYVSASYRF